MNVKVVVLGVFGCGGRLRRKGNKITLLAENPDIKPIEVNAKTDAFAIEGIGVGVIRAGKKL